MSAYMVDRDHIQFLVNAALRYQSCGEFSWYSGGERQTLPKGDRETAVKVGKMLWDENRKSIEARYPDCIGSDKLPGECNETFIYDRHSHSVYDVFDPVQVIKACRCLDYQSCEHPGWDASEAKAFLDSLLLSACSRLPGYEDAAWGAPRPLKKAGAR